MSPEFAPLSLKLAPLSPKSAPFEPQVGPFESHVGSVDPWVASYEPHAGPSELWVGLSVPPRCALWVQRWPLRELKMSVLQHPFLGLFSFKHHFYTFWPRSSCLVPDSSWRNEFSGPELFFFENQPISWLLSYISTIVDQGQYMVSSTLVLLFGQRPQ